MKDIKSFLADGDCPLCNGLIQVKEKCPACGESLEDGGTLEDFFGPYSPYEEVDEGLKSFVPEYKPEKCIHLFYCPVCGWDKRLGITKVSLE